MGHYYPISARGRLSHSGIPGMKWGVRRYQNPDGTYTVEGKARKRAYRESLKNREKKTEERVRGIKEFFQNRRLHSMSDDELNNYIERLNLEMKAKDLEYSLKYKYTKNYNPNGQPRTNNNNKNKQHTKFSDSGNPVLRFVARSMNKLIDTTSSRLGTILADDIVEDPNPSKKKKKE